MTLLCGKLLSGVSFQLYWKEGEAQYPVVCSFLKCSSEPIAMHCLVDSRIDETHSLMDGTDTLIDGKHSLIDGTDSRIDGRESLIDGTHCLANEIHCLMNGAHAAR